MQSRRMVLMLLSILLSALALCAQNPAPAAKPVSESGLKEALRIGGLTSQELANIIGQRGVSFQMTDQIEADLRDAGADTSLIEAVRANYRPPATKPATRLGPLSKNEIATLLDVGTPPARVQEIVNGRGVDFAMTDAIRRELAEAGADPSLLTAIEAKAGPASSPRIDATGSVPPATKPSTTANPVRKLTSLKEVHNLYVDKMNNHLDEYLQAELSKQLPGRFVLTAVKDDADALLIGRGEEQTGAGAAITGRYLGLHDTAKGAVSIVDKAGTVLWASEAGDRTLLFGPLKRGGAREVATRLVQELKKTLDALP